MPVDVCLTVDTEFRLGGTLRDPGRCRPVGPQAVTCEIGGHSHGLGFILDLLARHRLQATFFVEALNTFYFGDEPMSQIAQRLLQAGQDVQLHLHPVWLCFRDPHWMTTVRTSPPNGSCAGRDLEGATELIRIGLEIFERWQLPPPIALRTGNLDCDINVYRAMSRLGLPLASNVGMALVLPPDPALRLRGGRHVIEGVMEVPVLSYADLVYPGGRHWHLLSITGAGWAETESLLWAAHETDTSPVVIITHPFEYVKESSTEDGLRPNRVNQGRLIKLCAFLDRHRSEFRATGFASAIDGWLAAGPTTEPLLTVSPLKAGLRILENVLNDHLIAY